VGLGGGKFGAGLRVLGEIRGGRSVNLDRGSGWEREDHLVA